MIGSQRQVQMAHSKSLSQHQKTLKIFVHIYSIKLEYLIAILCCFELLDVWHKYGFAVWESCWVPERTFAFDDVSTTVVWFPFSNSKCVLASNYYLYLSMIDSRQLYRLSNFVFVTESLTFIAGTDSLPALESWYSLWTPVTLSSTIPKDGEGANIRNIGNSRMTNLTSRTSKHSPYSEREDNHLLMVNNKYSFSLYLSQCTHKSTQAKSIRRLTDFYSHAWCQNIKKLFFGLFGNWKYC
jgi:hypothetical protein